MKTTWSRRAPFAIGTRIGELQAMVYSRNHGETWEADVARAGHLEEHAEGFPGMGDAIHHALEYMNESGPAASQATGPERPPQGASRDPKVTGAST